MTPTRDRWTRTGTPAARATVAPQRLDRRTLLRGAGGAALALPLLEAMQPRRAAAQTTPRRFVVMFQPMGTIPDSWRPTGTETAFELSPILAPLEPHKRDLVVIDGVDQNGRGGGGHQIGIGGLLTGEQLNPGPFRSANGQLSGWAAGPSIDQEIAKVIAGGTKFRSRELGVFVRGATNNHRVCYAAADQPLAPESDPRNAAKALFRDVGSDPAAVNLRAQRRAVIDAVRVEYQTLRRRLGGPDATRLDAHIEAVREIEKRLDVVTPAAAACRAPAVEGAIELSSAASIPAIARLQIDILVAALACDLTRVASLQFIDSTSNIVYGWLGIREGHHSISHLPDSNADARDKMSRIHRWYSEQLAYLLAKMKEVREGERTLLDASLVFWGNGLAKGNTHTLRDAPLVLAGGAGGRLRTGRFLRYAGSVPHNNLLVSMANALGSPITRFGRAEWCTGPLAGLL
jgi:hypothetical protein